MTPIDGPVGIMPRSTKLRSIGTRITKFRSQPEAEANKRAERAAEHGCYQTLPSSTLIFMRACEGTPKLGDRGPKASLYQIWLTPLTEQVPEEHRKVEEDAKTQQIHKYLVCAVIVTTSAW